MFTYRKSSVRETLHTISIFHFVLYVHVSLSMTVSGGLVGITLHPNTLPKFFLIAPELA